MIFKLINPVIAGSFSKTYEAETAEEAGKMFWNALAIEGKYISGNVPQFIFTMKEENLLSNKSNPLPESLHHFVVSEMPEGKNASYSIKKLDLKMTASESSKLVDASTNAYSTALKLAADYQSNQNGGKRKKQSDDSSSSSDSSDSDVDDLFRSIRIKNMGKPIVYWWYTPSVYKVENIFTPTFVPSVTPLYTQLWIPLP